MYALFSQRPYKTISFTGLSSGFFPSVASDFKSNYRKLLGEKRFVLLHRDADQ